MRLTVFAAATVISVVALLGFAGTAGASATIDLIWADTETNEIGSVAVSDSIQLNVILTAGPNGALGADVGVNYFGVLGKLVVIGYASTPSDALPVTLGEPFDTGDRIEQIVAAAAPFVGAGIGLAVGQSHQLGTVTFHAVAPIHGVLEIQSDANGPTAGVLDLGANAITDTTTFNSAYLSGEGDRGRCSGSNGNQIVIEVNALRAGGKTVSAGANQSVDVTAKARILKGTAVRDTTLDMTLVIEAVDGTTVIGTNSTAFEAITLGVGKGGKGAKLAVDVPQCTTGFIDFIATFSGVDDDNDLCEGTRTLRKECR
jgi:hypothetical protein